MTTFLFLPGAGGAGWVWHRVVDELAARGHEAVAVDLPAADPKAGLEAYADIAVSAASGSRDVVLVALSMGAFTAALASTRIPLRRLVFLNAMIPAPGETPGAWWGNVQSDEARIAAAKRGGYSTDFDLATYFLHDIDPELAAELMKHDADEAKVAFADRAAFERWPSVPIHVLVGADDRLFPPELQERVARERLGDALTSLERVPGGHLAPLSSPLPIVRSLLAQLG